MHAKLSLGAESFVWAWESVGGWMLVCAHSGNYDLYLSVVVYSLIP